MSETIFEGPAIALGPLIGGQTSKAGNPWNGPGAEYQGSAVPDVRYYPANKDGLGAGRIPAFFNNPYFVLADGIPQAAATNALALAQTVSNGIAMTLVSTAASGSASGSSAFATNVPIVPVTGGAPVTAAIAIDYGFTTASTTSASATVTVPDSTLFSVGQSLVIGGAGNSAKTAPLLCNVVSIINATSITVAPAASGTMTRAACGSGNLYGLYPGGGSQIPTSGFPYANGGTLALFNPKEGLARCLSVTSVATSSGGALLFQGYDMLLQPMAETITATATAGTVFGKKAWKFITSITPQFSDANGTYSIGIGDTFGFHVRSDFWEYTNIFYNGAFVSSSAGWLKGDATTPATRTTGDPRGTVQVSVNGAGSTIASGTVTDGIRRLTLFMSVPMFNMVAATPANTVPMFGVTQAT